MKRIIALFLAVTLFFSGAGEVLAAAGVSDTNPNVNIRTTTQSLMTGYMAPRGVEISEDEDAGIQEVSRTENKYSEVYTHKWDKYSSNYYYNKLSNDEKELWDALDKICVYYLEKKVDIENYKQDSYGVTHPCLDTVSIDFEMSGEELGEFYNIFMLSNPQYYFVGSTYFYGSHIYTGKILTITLSCYPKFADGGDRATATKKVKTQIDKWEKIVNAYDTEEEKVKAIHDLICKKVTYNHGIYADSYISSEEEQQWLSQTAYSVLCMDTTVCAGYSDAMALMCNAVGIDAVSVTSWNHQWNKVRVNDTWYNYDATWADSNDSKIYYGYFARSDKFYIDDYSDGYSSHHEESFWANYSPNAVTDVVPTSPWEGPGTYPKTSKTVAAPKVSITHTDDGCTVKITCSTKKAKIYYTIDGKTPGIASAKSTLYKKSFKVKKDCKVKAIAVCDGYKDSKVVTQQVSTKGTSIKNAKVKLSKTKYYYTGSAKKPEVTLTLNGKELVEDKDFEVSYKNNRNIGEATVTITGIGRYQGTLKKKFTITAKTGTKFTEENNKYKVINSSTVAFIGIKSNKTKVTVPSTVKYGGKSFKVTKIADNALKSKTKVKEVVIGTNIKEIGKQVFYGCKNLKTITIKSTKITKVGKNALKGINSKATIKVAEKKLKDYKSLFKNKGQGKNVKIVKNK